jgi:pimeloyl-ACP methyl ester carboxylesterase
LSCSDLREGQATTYVIIHGLGGRTPGDRFCQLAAAIRQQCPECDVLLVDWSQAASVGLPLPFQAARNIDPVAKEAAQLLRELGVDLARTTFIGESFGNYVAAKMAAELGQVSGMLVCNPANEFGSYTPPDLRKVAARSISFHTYSPYDTRREIAHADLFLETPAGASHSAQHTAGISWIALQVRRDRLDWLQTSLALPARKTGGYCGKATLTGEVEDAAVLRQPPENLAAQ